MQGRFFGRSRFGKAFVSLFAGLTLAIGAGFFLSADHSRAAGSSVALPALASMDRNGGEQSFPTTGTFAPLVKEAAPAVVSIQSERTAKASAGMQGLPFFFGQPRGGEMPERKQRGMGSGVIVTDDGYILTNHHVIADADEVTVVLGDDREFEAKVIGSDSKTDIAVVKIDAYNLPTLPLGNSDAVEVGDIVLAMGNPFGVGQTVTQGIVGATSRAFGITGQGGYEDFIQTDAAINPGNSGGALVNTHGQLIGINTAIMSRSGGNDGVGFAVPVNLAHQIMTQLVENGRVVRGYMGVGIQDVRPAMSQSLKLPDAKGAVVTKVEADGPAAEAGFKPYDVIRSVNGRKVDDARELRLGVASTAPGETVEVTVIRDGEEKALEITLGEFPGEEEPVRASNDSEETPKLGVSVEALTPEIAESIGADPTLKGVVIAKVEPGSPAAEAGLRRGDVIQEVARKPVTSVGELRSALQAAGDAPLLMVWSQGGSHLVVVGS